MKRAPRGRERRNSPRKPVTWTGRFGLGATPEWEWRTCSIEDISEAGARVTTHEAVAARVGDSIAVAVERLGTTAVGIRLHGQVRYCEMSDDTLELGVALEFRTPQERRLAESLFAG